MQTEKKEIKRREYAELEKLADKGGAGKMYEKMLRLPEGFNTGSYLCRKQCGNLTIRAY